MTAAPEPKKPNRQMKRIFGLLLVLFAVVLPICALTTNDDDIAMVTSFFSSAIWATFTGAILDQTKIPKLVSLIIGIAILALGFPAISNLHGNLAGLLFFLIIWESAAFAAPALKWYGPKWMAWRPFFWRVSAPAPAPASGHSRPVAASPAAKPDMARLEAAWLGWANAQPGWHVSQRMAAAAAALRAVEGQKDQSVAVRDAQAAAQAWILPAGPDLKPLDDALVSRWRAWAGKNITGPRSCQLIGVAAALRALAKGANGEQAAKQGLESAAKMSPAASAGS
jgi:hypothetical protein